MNEKQKTRKRPRNDRRQTKYTHGQLHLNLSENLLPPEAETSEAAAWSGGQRRYSRVSSGGGERGSGSVQASAASERIRAERHLNPLRAVDGGR